jgi:hypothetical protein
VDLLTAHLVVISHATAPRLLPLLGFLVAIISYFQSSYIPKSLLLNLDLKEAHDG